MNSPLVSVVVPAYNQVAFIEQAITSVLSQAEVDLELVVADHSSSDGTFELTEQFTSDPRLRLLRTPAGGGAARNFERASREARGTYLKLLPGDDYLLAGALKAQVDALESTPDAVLAASRRRIVDARGGTIVAQHGLPKLVGAMSGDDAIRATVRAGTNVFGEPGAVLMRRSAYEAAGGWDFRHPFLVDEATYVRVLRHGRFVGLPDAGAAFRLNNGQWSVALTKDQYTQAAGFHAMVAEEFPEIISKTDVARGNRNAWILAQRRRLVYQVLRRRMSRAD